ncbi:unnamed protein product [Parnassius apollo]|uniref:(apollo) hypothetical protein n=1 Tax=Parnassius apollo TaxID=110799 RepID=A0A8S3WHN1_PARAO|nr:unnamed protein product [Parnassius apollo]
MEEECEESTSLPVRYRPESPAALACASRVHCEFLDTLSRVARGSVQEKLYRVFALYNVDGDGRISRSEMLAVVQAVYELLGWAAAPPVLPASAKDHVDKVFDLMDTNGNGVVSPDELARWHEPALLQSLQTLDTVL